MIIKRGCEVKLGFKDFNGGLTVPFSTIDPPILALNYASINL